MLSWDQAEARAAPAAAIVRRKSCRGRRPMPVIIDKQVFVQIASNNKQAAEALLKRLASGDPVYMSTVAKNELITQSKGGLGPQYEKLMDDLKIKVPPATNMADRIGFHADNVQMGKLPKNPAGRPIPAKDIVNLHG